MPVPLLRTWVKCIAISLSLFVSQCILAQFTPTHTFTIESNTSTVYPSGSGEQGCHIFPNGRIGIVFNNYSTYRVYKNDGTMLSSFNLNVAGFTPGRVVGLSNNQLLLLRGTQFAIINLAGQVVLAATSTGMTTYAGANYLDGVELSDGNIALSVYAADGSNQIRVFTKAGAAVSGIVNVKTTGTGRPSPQGGTYYSGQLAAGTNGTFLFVYTTYFAGIHGVLFNNDGTMRTWPATGNNHYQLFTATGQDGFELFSLPDGSFMVSVWRSNTGGYKIDSDGTILSNSITRGLNSYNIGALAVNRKTGGNYSRGTNDETVGTTWSSADNFTGTKNIFAEQRTFTGSVSLAKQAIATGYYNVIWNDVDFWYDPDVRPAIYGVSSIQGGSGGYGFIIQNFNNSTGSSWSLTLRLYEVSGTLPVKLESFQGKKQNESAVLDWKTSEETAFSHFEVEWSSDGRTFATAGIVRANAAKTYSFTHPFTSDMSKETKLYYRLKMIDADDSYTYSNVVTINNSNFSDIKIYPVPATDHIWIEVPANVSRQQPVYSIVTSAGQTVQQGKITQTVQKIILPAIAPGTYHIRLNDETGKSFLKK
jgi:hypothetical protein